MHLVVDILQTCATGSMGSQTNILKLVLKAALFKKRWILSNKGNDLSQREIIQFKRGRFVNKSEN